MSTSSDIILNHRQICHKITRLAWQVYENNMDEAEIWIAGIDQRGEYLARRVSAELSSISPQKIRNIRLRPDINSAEGAYVSEDALDGIEGAAVILVDDVLNTGKTMMKAILPLMERRVRKIQVLVLASRSHRLFPLKADFVGISMASTLQEHLDFDNSNENDLRLRLS